MVTIKASIVLDNEKRLLMIKDDKHKIMIPVTEDKSNEVKNAFNRLIVRIKQGEFQIELDKIGDDLFSQVAKEYIAQLNREIKEVHGEMKRYGLVAD